MYKSFKKSISLLAIMLSFLAADSQTLTYDNKTTWTVPNGVSSITVTVYGAGGGEGGRDCNGSCANRMPGNVVKNSAKRK